MSSYFDFDTCVDQLASDYSRRMSPCYIVSDGRETKEEYNVRLAIYELEHQISYNLKNIYNWSEDEIKTRSSQFQCKISPAYHVRRHNETKKEFDLRMALLSIKVDRS